jgi:hypothetical protein
MISHFVTACTSQCLGLSVVLHYGSGLSKEGMGLLFGCGPFAVHMSTMRRNTVDMWGYRCEQEQISRHRLCNKMTNKHL